MKNLRTQEEFISNITDPNEKSRIPLTGTEFEILNRHGEIDYTVRVEKLVGTGASCLVYEVVVDDRHPPLKNMIMKEFYPSFREQEIHGVRNPENPLHKDFIAASKEAEVAIAYDRQKFIDSYAKHIEIMEIDPILRDKIVRPYRLEEADDYLFALYDTDTALSVDKYYNLDLAIIISILKQTAEILTFLHQKDIIYMDLKPANILYDYNRDKVKLFDFDAAVFLDNLDDTNEFFMPSQRAFIPPELRYVSNINKRKDIFITEEIDLYMLGVTFFYLLMDRYPSDLENENMDYLERNLQTVLSKISNQIFLNPSTTYKIIELFKETISYHRYLTVDQFRNRLDEIQAGLDVDRNINVTNILSAAYIIDSNPLFDYIQEDEHGKYIDVAIIGDLNRALEFFNLMFASVDLADVELRFNIYTKSAKDSYNQMTRMMPLLRETCKIYIDDRVRDDKLNTSITDKYYATINFKKNIKDIDDHYIIILHEDGENHNKTANKLFDKYKDVEENRFIVNYTRMINEIETHKSDYIKVFNVDISSAATFRNKEYSESILEQAFNVHTFYARAYGGERTDIYDIWTDFIKGDLYNLKSSMRAALSMRYKLYRAGSLDAEDPADDFYKKVVAKVAPADEVTMRDLFADSEHHSWNRFMITLGYNVPTKEQFRDYAYVGFNNHIDRVNKLHPLIANSDIRKYKNGEEDIFEQVSDSVHDFLRFKTQNADKRVLDRINHTLLNTNWHYNDNLRAILPFWEELLNVTLRIIDQEAFSANTWELLRGVLEDRLAEEFLGKEEVYADYLLIKKDIDLIIERNSKKSFRVSDYMIIDAIPLIKSNSVKTIFKPFVAEEGLLWANVLAAIKYSPRNLILISDSKEDLTDKYNRIVDFMKNKRLQRTLNIELITYEEMDLYSKEDAIVDLTLNSHTDAKRKEIREFDYLEYLGSNEWSGDFKAIDYYINEKTLTVEETFYLNNAYYYNAKAENNLSRLNNYYEKIWQAYLSYPSYQWREFNRLFKTSRNKYILNLSYPECEKTSMLEVGDFIFKRDAKLRYPKLVSFLNDLVEEGIVIDYEFPINPGKIKLHTINDYLTVELGDFISKSLKHHFTVFDFRKLYFPLMDEDDNRNFYYYGMSNNVYFSYDVKYKDPTRIAYELNQFMENLDAGVDNEREIRIFNHLGDKPYVRDGGDKIEFNYELGDIAFREFFEKGIALKIYTYFELIRKSVSFDEIKIDVGLKWKAYGDYSPISEGVENTLDIVATKGFSTFIITCVQEDVTKDFIYEIKNHSKQFGIDTTPILISSYSEGLDPSIQKIADATGVYFIDRDMLKKASVVQYLENIANVESNWQDIN